MSNPAQELNAQAAAELLAQELGGDAPRWLTWLANDRRPGRAGLIPPMDGPGRPRYLLVVLEAFIEAERAKRARSGEPMGRAAEVMRAFGIGEEGGSRTGRKLDCIVTAQLDDDDNPAREGFVQFHITSPMLVYRLSIEQARLIAAQLLEEASGAERYQNIVKQGAAS